MVKSDNNFYSYDTLGGWLEISEPTTEQDFVNYGFDKNLLPEVSKEEWEELSHVSIIFWTDDPSIEEITIETETEPFTIYDEMGESMEVLYYTDDENREEAELHITANYSPLDELDDFEVVTWTDNSDAKLILEMTALPQPQFTYTKTPHNITGFLKNFHISEVEVEGFDEGIIRFLFSPDKKAWKTWDGKSFVNIDIENKQNIFLQGMTLDKANSLDEKDWEKWDGEKIYIGVYLEESVRDTDRVLIENISVSELLPTETTKVSDAKLYILNTVSTIDVTFVGKTITGNIDDADKGKVQYRIVLNGQPYYPTDGSFTPLMPSPLNITTTLKNDSILMDQNNVLRIEFQDYWGSTDYWETNFIGTYSGLMFLDELGEYYSSDVGELLKYLDFGTVIAGQTTLEHKIVLRNMYGYDVKNIKLEAKQETLPSGVKAQFGTNNTSFEALEELVIDGHLQDGEELEFYVRLATVLGAEPVTNGEFDIVVTADKVD